jgi:hypothetical protein
MNLTGSASWRSGQTSVRHAKGVRRHDPERPGSFMSSCRLPRRSNITEFKRRFAIRRRHTYLGMSARPGGEGQAAALIERRHRDLT